MKHTLRPLLVGTVLTTILSSASWAAEKVGVVGAAGVTLRVVGEDKSTRILKTGDDIFLGDTLTSDAQGKAQIVFLDRSTITIKPNSNLTIDTFVYDPQTSGGTLALKSAKGAFRFVGGALSKKKPVTLTTPVGTIGIRGGIADTRIDASGKTDSFFVYGQEMSFTNQDGDQLSTTQFSSGLSVTSPDAAPQSTPTQDVAAHFEQFRPATTDAPLPGAPSADAINSNLDIGTENAAPLPEGDNQAVSNSSSDNNTAESDGDNNGTSNDTGNASEGGSTAADGNSSSDRFGFGQEDVGGGESANISPPVVSTFGSNVQLGRFSDDSGVPANLGSLASTASQNTYDNAIASVASSGPIIPGSTLSTNSRRALPPLANNGVGSEVVGRFIKKTYIGGDDTVVTSEGRIAGFQDGTDFRLVYSPLYGGGIESIVLPALPPGNGAEMFDQGALFNIGGITYNSIRYRNGSGSINYYQLADTSAPANQIAAIFGRSVVNNANPDLSSAINATKIAVNSATGGNSSNVAFYDFGPSLREAQLTTNARNMGVFDYNLRQNAGLLSGYGCSGNSCNLPQNALGLAVDYANNQFLTGFLQFDNPTLAATTAYDNRDLIPQLMVSFGTINASGPSYFNGAIISYEGIDQGATITNTTSPNSLARGEKGNFFVNNQIYGSENGPIDGFIINQQAAVKDFNNVSFDTTSASTTVTITDPNHGLSTGEVVALRTAGNVGGLSLAQFNNNYVVTVLNANQYTITTATNAPSTANGSLFSTKFKNDSDAQLAISRPLGNDTPSNSLRADIAAKATLPASRTLQGYAGGLGIYEDGANLQSNAVARYTNDDISKVTVTQDRSNNSVSALIELQKNNDSSAGIKGTFNATGSSFIGNRLWAVDQSATDFISASMPYAGSQTKGALVAGTHLVDQTKTAVCTACQFVEWGVWAGESTTPTGKNFAVNMIPVVVGDVTTNLPIGAGTATYNGQAYGNFQKGDNTSYQLANAVGTLTATVDMANRSIPINGLSMDFGTVLGTPITISNNAIIPFATSGAAIGDTTSVRAGMAAATFGKLNVALFGPNAENIGGNFSVNQPAYFSGGADLNAAGVFLGAR